MKGERGLEHNRKYIRMVQVFFCLCLVATLLFSGAGIIYAQPPGCTVYEYCHLEECDNASYIYDDGTDNWWFAQTFTAISDHQINRLSLPLFKSGSPGKLTVSIQSTVGGLPSGMNLGTGDIYPEEISATSFPGEWVGTSIDTVSLSSGILYALVVRAEGGNLSNSMRWCIDDVSDSNPSPMPDIYFSRDGGASWQVNDTTSRRGFELYLCEEEPEVGGEAYLVNRVALMAPWLALAVVITAGGVYLVRRRVHS
jgi:hypothetical protein